MLRHVPVLLDEIIEVFPEKGSTYLDGTLGHAGHTQALLAHFPTIKLVWIDKDEHMITKAKHFLWDDLERISLVQWSYHEFDKIKKESWIDTFDCILLDLGVNMDHFKVAERGFSIKLDGALDMRFDTSSWIPVSEWLKKTHFEELDSLFERYTDFWQTYREWISRELIKQKRKNPFKTTGDVKVRAKKNEINAKVLAILFQARRIFINDELVDLEKFLDRFDDFLLPWGRCCVITYHSSEDRLVKVRFKELVDNKQWILYNKKVIKPNRKEMERNKASRSAKLRIFEKI